MVGGNSKFALIRTHAPIHTQLISQNGKEIEITHRQHSSNGGWYLGKINKNKIDFSVGVDTWINFQNRSNC